MNKAILVIDMPDSCDKCPLMFRHEEERCCMPEGRNSFTTKPSWCPLMPMPRMRLTYIGDKTIANYNRGWNDCLDEIKG